MIVRPADYLTASLSPGASTANLLASRPMAGDLAYYLAVDAPETVRLASPSDLSRWKLSEDAAWNRATANIKLRVGTLQPLQLGSETGPSGFGAESGLAPSMLADPKVCGPGADMKGLLVLVQGRDVWLYATEQERTQLDLLARSADSMSHTVLACMDGRWTVARR